MTVAHIIFNIYLIILLVGVLTILLRLHDIKLILKTFMETTNLISKYVDLLETEIKKDEDMIEYRVNKLHSDILKIIRELHKNK